MASQAQPIFEKEVVVQLPSDIYAKCGRFAFDLGSSLAKIVYKHKDDEEDFLLNKTATGKLRCRYVNGRDVDGIVKFIKDHVKEVSGDGDSTVHGTGLATFRHMDKLQKDLGVQVQCQFEQVYQINWALFINSTGDVAPYVEQFDQDYEQQRIKHYQEKALFNAELISEYRGSAAWLAGGTSLQYPLLYVMAGSCCGPYIVSDARGTHSDVRNFSLGGKVFAAWGCLLTGARSVDELLALAAAGDAGNVDTSLRDVFKESKAEGAAADEGYDAELSSLDADATVFRFGKLADDLGRRAAYRPADIAASYVATYVGALVEFLHYRAVAEGISQVLLYGSFFESALVRRHVIHHVTAQNVTSLLNRKPAVEFHALRAPGFAGALGAAVWPAHQNPTTKMEYTGIYS